MENEIKIFIGIIVIAIIIILIFLYNRKSSSFNNSYDDFYTITYTTSYSKYKVFEEGKNYDVIKDKESLNLILDKVKNTEYKNTFDNKFFENNNLLVIEAEINPELNKCEINNDKVDILVYVASPLVSSSGYNVYLANFTLYLIPISKNIKDNNISVEVTTYPDKAY